MEVPEILLQVPSILFLRNPIDAYRCVSANPVIRAPERLHIDVVRQRE
jgi:hypothetical protein